MDKNYKLFGKILDANKFIPYIDLFESFPKYYGSYQKIKAIYPEDTTCWESYKSFDTGEISFLRNIWNTESLRNMMTEVSISCNTLFNNAYITDPTRILILKTTGSIGLHTDNQRLSAMNIGLFNTGSVSISVTNVNDNNFETYTFGDGEAVLLNVKAPHFITCNINLPRYIFSFDFKSESYEYLYNL